MVSCHLKAYQFLDSFGVFPMQRREFLKSAATCAVASTLPKAFGQQENPFPANQIHRRLVP
ncbi:MAG: hypothetical protein DMG76_10915 [Acidobacteria bacterium]|nr:MAG: hypothetical protein DMG76_10915 [Acidobacteriota bacterium]